MHTELVYPIFVKYNAPFRQNGAYWVIKIKVTEFGVRVTDQSLIVMVCERKFTFCHKVLSIKSK